MIFRMTKDNEQIKIGAYSEDKLVCEYICYYQKELNICGADLLKTTLLSWATLDFSVTDVILIEIQLSMFEYTYIEEQYKYCTKTYMKMFDYEKAELIYRVINKKEYEKVPMDESYYLGFTEGKDSTLCKELINSIGKQIVYYKVSYDDDNPAEDGHIYCHIVNEELYNRFTITGWKANSNIISFQQADDIHVTFACPYAYEKENYSKYLAVGIPWDAIHSFSGGEPDLVATETYHSIQIFEKLVKNYGFHEFKMVSPIATLHTYGVYGILERIIGIEQLEKLDSCWESYSYKGNSCGYCPKCQRLKKVFWDCFDYDNSPEIPKLEIKSADFLFGSIFATKLLSFMPAKKIMNTMLVDEYSRSFSGEFFEILKQQFQLKELEGIKFAFSKDEQTWDGIREHLVNVVGMDYAKLIDVRCNQADVPYLPFEKYYCWLRKERVLHCYDIVQWKKSGSGVIKQKRISEGKRCLQLPDSNLFRQYIENTPFYDMI